nr:FMN-binding protein [Atopobacter phocae]
MQSKLIKSSLLLSSVFVLAACGSSNDDKKEDTAAKTEQVEKDMDKKVDENMEMDKDMDMSDEPLQDGMYKLETDLDEHGWMVDFTMEVKDGKIVASNYDYKNEKGELKSEDEEYNKSMKEKTGTSVKEAMEKLNAELVEKQNPMEVEVVSGATHTSESFKDYAMQLIKAAQEGKTDTIKAK